ncbi:MAG: GNAT family N-acetyltransferase [Lachnospiraceae bacterium]
MFFHYESENLNYDILSPQDAGRMLEFYQFNKDIFEPYEPDKPSTFYTLDYQTSLAKLEYEGFLRGKNARFWITRKNQPNIIGCVSFVNIIKGSFLCCNIAYKIHKSHQGLGYASEAVSFLTNVMFEDCGLHRIEAYVHPDNAPSVALAEKCGFVYDGIVKDYVSMRGKWVDHLRYTLIHK